MGFIIDFIIKITGFRKFFALAMLALQISLITSYLAFAISLGVAVGKAYSAVSDFVDSWSSSSSLGTVGGNDIGAIVWSALHAIGFVEVLTTYMPIMFSTLVFYLSIYLANIVLTFQKNVYRSIQDLGVIFLG